MAMMRSTSARKDVSSMASSTSRAVRLRRVLTASPLFLVRAPRSSRIQKRKRSRAERSEARRKFRAYWSFLSPGIILIRAAMLPQLRDAADRARHLEGDDLYPDARALFTHAVTIAGPVRNACAT
jgi:hypothetical protein